MRGHRGGGVPLRAASNGLGCLLLGWVGNRGGCYKVPSGCAGIEHPRLGQSLLIDNCEFRRGRRWI